jgi:hypothetical protein
MTTLDHLIAFAILIITTALAIYGTRGGNK